MLHINDFKFRLKEHSEDVIHNGNPKLKKFKFNN